MQQGCVTDGWKVERTDGQPVYVLLENDALWLGGPVGGGEREPVVSPSVQGINLGRQIDR